MSTDSASLGTIRTQVPARLDRLPWAKFHWRVVVGLGSAWALDGLEVTIVSTVSGRLTSPESGLNLTAAQIGYAGGIYVLGACLGALFFGKITDRLGRKRLFMVTLAVYLTATALTALSFNPIWFFVFRFFTGSGIGGEYAAINSAIDELIPARARGTVDILINGTYWGGAALGAAAAIPLLNEAWVPGDVGWRAAFGLGVIFGLVILVVRRGVPESPRWLFIHGDQEGAERLVDGIEREVSAETGEELPPVSQTLTVRQRRSIPFREIAKVAFKTYPKRSILAFSLFVGQAFLYNGVTFDLGTIMTTYFGVAAALVPVFTVVYAVGNFLGPITLGRLFDTVGRKKMITGTYLSSALAALLLAGLVAESNLLNSWTFIVVVIGVFFLASPGTSAAYLTASEIFPMETRALAIAFFYAWGTAAGGIAGPFLFGSLIDTGSAELLGLSFLIGALVMAAGGIVEIVFGINAEQQSLENIAKPLTAEDAEQQSSGQQRGAEPSTAEDDGTATERARDRYRPGPGRGTVGTPSVGSTAPPPESAIGGQTDEVVRVLTQRGPLRRDELGRRVGAHNWGPGAYRAALRHGIEEGRIARRARGDYVAVPQGQHADRDGERGEHGHDGEEQNHDA
jgi:MFS family permease